MGRSSISRRKLSLRCFASRQFSSASRTSRLAFRTLRSAFWTLRSNLLSSSSSCRSLTSSFTDAGPPCETWCSRTAWNHTRAHACSATYACRQWHVTMRILGRAGYRHSTRGSVLGGERVHRRVRLHPARLHPDCVQVLLGVVQPEDGQCAHHGRDILDPEAPATRLREGHTALLRNRKPVPDRQLRGDLEAALTQVQPASTSAGRRRSCWCWRGPRTSRTGLTRCG